MVALLIETRNVVSALRAAALIATLCAGACSSKSSDSGAAAAGSAGSLNPNGGSGNPQGGSGTGGGTATGGSSAGGTSSTSGGSATGGSGTGGSSTCADSCPAPKAGVTFGCEKRFFYGVNYPWNTFGWDFGGAGAGVAQNRAAILADLRDLAGNGVDVVRWWMYPDLDAPGIVFDSSGSPTGLGGSSVADVQAAIDLAVQAGVHLNLTLFSFDDFNWSNTRRMKAIITDSGRRAALMNVVRQIARTAEQTGNGDRVVAWDVINEPEWAISDSDPYGDPTYGVDATTLEGVTFAQMETFVRDAVSALKAESPSLVTVGGAAIKWPKAWSHVGLDFYTFHWYDWVQQWYPYTQSPAQYGITDKPVVIGEFPLSGIGADSYATVVQRAFDAGYAGTMPWAMNDNCCGSWANVKSAVKAFAAAHACETHY